MSVPTATIQLLLQLFAKRRDKKQLVSGQIGWDNHHRACDRNNLSNERASHCSYGDPDTTETQVNGRSDSQKIDGWRYIHQKPASGL
jgi:hypothetical protein